MKAIVHDRYGPPDILQLKDMEKPVPLEDEVLVEVGAASVNAYDWHFLTADVFLIRLMGGGLTKPNDPTLGADIAGRVTAVGKNVRRFQPGDEVFGAAKGGKGGFAEFVCARDRSLEKKPANLSFEEAAAVPMAALTALQGLRDRGHIQPGLGVLIYGASGGVGTFAVQIAKSYGAEVTAVCSSRNVETARSIGADHVIDYTSRDFTKDGRLYDLIFVANGNIPTEKFLQSLTPGGTCVLAGGGITSTAELLMSMCRNWWISKTGSRKVGSFMATINQGDLAFMRQLIENGRVRPVIDRRYPLDDTREALRYLGEGHARGKVVITLAHSNKT